MISIPKGTKDVLPQESYKWHFVENHMREIARRFCLNEIRTPVFEHTELFLRGVGDTTDIVNKEMYTFEDKGGRSMTLKPEGTAGVARSFIENSLSGGAQPTKMYYMTPVFRYEKPQAGRLREHHQFGVEIYGSERPEADVETMLIASELFRSLGITDLTLFINSIGCKSCRKRYNEALKQYFAAQIDNMCPVCRERLDKNPLRILDCKEERCIEINKHAPIVLNYLCDDCKEHHETVLSLLDGVGVAYQVNPYIVRGLDYYTRTVFEFVSNKIGAQGTVCGGGRYNHLVEEVGGKPCPSVGFGMGIERLILTLTNLGLPLGQPQRPDVYIAPVSEEGRRQYLSIALGLRTRGIAVETDFMGRSFKAQMKYADKIGAALVIILGESEMQSGKVQIKRMQDGAQQESPLEQMAETVEKMLNGRV